MYNIIFNIENFRTKEKYSLIYKCNEKFENDIPLIKLFWMFNVSKSGYNSWIKRGMPLHGNYDKNLLNIITEIFYDRKKPLVIGG